MTEKYYDKEIETASPHQLESLKSYRLSKTVSRVFEKVPYYRNKMLEAKITPDDIRSTKDLQKLPFTVKQDLRDTYPYGLFAVDSSQLVRIHASSGTTGKQTVVGYTENDIEMWSQCVARAIVAAGGSKDDFLHISYGYGLFTGGLGLHYGAEKLGATAIPVSAGNTKRQIQIIKDFGSTILCCTPSYALFIAETMSEMNIDRSELKLKSGIFGAEPWTDEMRNQIEQSLGIKAFDIYGLSEIVGPGVSFECEYQSGLHINEDHFIPEIINPDTGEVLSEGEAGELVFTCITKEALPLIRYRTRDITSLNYQKCECGRTLVRMNKPCGRTDDMLIIRGINVFPSQIESVLLELGLTTAHYMLVIDRKNNLDTLEILVEMSESMFSDEVRKIEETEDRIRSAIESTLSISAKVKLCEPKSIPRSEGKAKRVLDKRLNK